MKEEGNDRITDGRRERVEEHAVALSTGESLVEFEFLALRLIASFHSHVLCLENTQSVDRQHAV